MDVQEDNIYVALNSDTEEEEFFEAVETPQVRRSVHWYITDLNHSAKLATKA